MSHKQTVQATELKLLRPLMQRDITLPARMSWDSWIAHESVRAAKVDEYREYANGSHDIELSAEMKDMLRSDTLNLNHCENILETLSDRLRLGGFGVTVSNEDGTPDEEATEEAEQWVERLTQHNRLDALQIQVHDACPEDGLTYIIPEWDEENKRVVWHHNEAYDGHSGALVVWGDDGQTPTMGIKVWHETQAGNKSQLIDHVRINLYYPDKIQKYISRGGGSLVPYTDEDGEYEYDWTMTDGTPLGVAVIPFVYKSKTYNKHGLGRLENVIPVQRALNRVLNSMIMTSENIGFPVRYSLGMDVPAKIQPGTWIKATVPEKKTLSNGNKLPLEPEERAKVLDAITKIRVGQLDPAELDGLLSELDKLITQMYVISGTPYPEGAGANISGEALKQLDIRLVGTAERCQTGWGNSWEDLVMLSARMEATFNGRDPLPKGRTMVSAQWRSAEIRDDAVTLDNAKKTVEVVGDMLDVRTRLEMVAEVHGWSKSRIDEIEKRMQEAASQALANELGLTVGNNGSAFTGAGMELGDPLNNPVNVN